MRVHGVRRRWRILPRMPAGTAESGDRFRQPCGVVCGEKREWRERGSGGFIGAALVAIQRVGNARGSNSGDVTGRGERERSGGGDDRWGPAVGERGGELGTGSGIC
jgi:hypothetical protein